MNVSLRSQMVAGVAALGATAVAIVPIAQQEVLPSMQRATAAVQLTGFANPVAAVLGSLSEVNSYLLDTYTFDDAGVTWPDNFYGTYTYAPFNLGIVPDAVNQFSSGALSALVNNLSGYGWAGIQTAVELGIDVSDSVFNTPGAVITAVQELIAGDPQAAIDALVTGIIDPLKYGVQYTLAAGQYVLSNLAENLGTVVSSFLPYLTKGLIGSVVGGVTALTKAAIATVVAVVQDVVKLDIQSAWNGAVDGFLGPEGTLGQSIKWAIGPGLTDDQDVVTVASPRAVVTSELQRLGSFKSLGDDGINNDPFYPPSPAAAKAAAAAPALAAAEAPAVVEAASPAVEVSQAEAPKVEAPAASSAELGNVDVAKAVDNAVAESASDSGAQKPSKRPARAAARGDNAAKAERAARSAR
ncbi:MAG: hypothetical protein KIH64_012450 [Mycobacterium sp.]|nr:hypothetical protein [Mycobacterium sp.]